MRQLDHKTTVQKPVLPTQILTIILQIVSVLCIAGVVLHMFFETMYKNRVYPGISVGDVYVGGKTTQEIESYWLESNTSFNEIQFTLEVGENVATLSGMQLDMGFDATLSANQAYLVGRSGHVFSDIYNKFLKGKTQLQPVYKWNQQFFHETLEELATSIDIPVQEALFQFNAGRVTAFRPSREGTKLNIEETEKEFTQILASLSKSQSKNYIVPVKIDTIAPSITTDQVNVFGIKELLGRGYSEFKGSIPGRVHNIVLAASRVNGILIKPGDTFSFNNSVGDISAATGYQSAYIIKDGRTVLGDGGGVCQVSTTLFRAALEAGLPVHERTAHSYRVRYYELGGYKPGLDATVYNPTYDLTITNDTSTYILIQAIPNTKNMTLTFELYGTNDGRKSEIINHKVWGVTAPPPDLYQDDPTLPAGTVKQVDWSAWGTKASFDYIVRRDGEVITEKTFFSNYRPWQSVYLRGTQ